MTISQTDSLSGLFSKFCCWQIFKGVKFLFELFLRYQTCVGRPRENNWLIGSCRPQHFQ